MQIRKMIRRYPQNPILTPEQMPFDCYTVFNSGAIRFKGKYLMLLRAEKFDMSCNFYVATSEDGFNFTVNPNPVDYPLREVEIKHRTHRFDARITEIEGVYYIYHAVWTKFGSSIALVKTTDFINFEPYPYISVPSNRNAVLFPEKINGMYARLERPQDVNGTGNIWISYSPDLEFWGKSTPLNVPNYFWSSRKVGAGAVPIKTSYGWLEIYHGTNITASTENYYLGVMLLDLKDPAKIISAPAQFILASEKDYECVGQVPNVVFTCGAVETDDGQLNIYYGAADTRMCVAQTTIQELLQICGVCEKQI